MLGEHDLKSGDGAAITEESELTGTPTGVARFVNEYRLAVLGVHRPGREGPLDPATSSMRPGDVLLVQGTGGQLALGHLGPQVVVAVEAELGAQQRLQRGRNARMADQGVEFGAEDRLVPGAQTQLVVGMEKGQAAAKRLLLVQR